VYVFAITQLSHYLLGHANLRGALQAGLLLLMVWLVWVRGIPQGLGFGPHVSLMISARNCGV
jgi:hypothetical protein